MLLRKERLLSGYSHLNLTKFRHLDWIEIFGIFECMSGCRSDPNFFFKYKKMYVAFS